jgi:ribosomal protein L14
LYWCKSVYTEKTGDNIQFPDNAILMLSDNKKKLLGTRIYGSLQREALRIKKLEEALVQKIVLLSRFVI